MDGVGDKHQSEEMWQHPAPRGKKASTPAERKQRRLESNRAAAKRAYYRRQDKVQTMRRENSLLRGAAVEHRFKIAIYESLLRRLGVDPEVAVEAIRGSAKPVHAAAAGQQSSAAAQEIGDETELQPHPAPATSLPTSGADQPSAEPPAPVEGVAPMSAVGGGAGEDDAGAASRSSSSGSSGSNSSSSSSSRSSGSSHSPSEKRSLALLGELERRLIAESLEVSAAGNVNGALAGGEPQLLARTTSEPLVHQQRIRAGV